MSLVYLAYHYLVATSAARSRGLKLPFSDQLHPSARARIETLQMSPEEEGRLLGEDDYLNQMLPDPPRSSAQSQVAQPLTSAKLQADEELEAESNQDAESLNEDEVEVSEPKATPTPFKQHQQRPVAATAAVPPGNNDDAAAAAAAAESESSNDAEEEDTGEDSGKDDVVGGEAFGGTFDGVKYHLDTQIVLPANPILQHFDSSQNYWPLHSILKQRGWSIATQALPSRVNLWISKGAVPPRMKRGSQMLNSMGVSGCIGGAKTLQLSCRRRLATYHGCDYDLMKIQPPQYNMLDLEDCRRLFETRDGNPDLLFLVKPSYTFHGSGIRLLKFKDVKTEFAACKTPKHAIVMDYVAKPATMMGGYKFDFRSYLLVASLNPQLVFYHDGFVRKSDKMYNENAKDMNVHITNKVTQSKEDHFFNFTTLAWSLHHESGLPRDHVDAYVRPRAQNVSRFLFHTARVQAKPPAHVPGRFHLFGIDWLLDNAGKLHLLEGNGYPLVTHYEGIDLTPRIWEEMTDLILAIHTKPATLGTKLGAGFRFGGWTLIFNELEESYQQSHGRAYNACRVFTEN